MSGLVIAIDGPAASGKGTLARRLAEYFDLPHLDTGLLYRATACALLDEGLPLDDEEAATVAARGLSLTDFDDARLRSREMGEAASVVAALPQVRAELVDLQRRFAAREEGAVLDGRDIGTVICPGARAKIFVTATPETDMQITESELLDMLAAEAILDRDRLTREARLSDLGVSSIDVISLLFELEERTGVQIEEGDMPQMETLGEMVDHLLSKLNTAGAGA